MVPDNTSQDTAVLEESERIKGLLVDVQKQVEATTQEAVAALLKDSRKKLGYENIETGDDKAITDTRIKDKTPVITPKMLALVLPVSRAALKTTGQSRAAITAILEHEDDRLLAVVGPCSIHDPKAALEYAGHVKKWREQYGGNLEIVMRAYMEKPRTELGWKGFIYDPLLNESDDINLGVVATRLLSCQITNMGVPIAMERLNALTPQYVNALVAYDVVGARNTTDQKSREYASATSSPIGFKNTPEGSVTAAAQAIVSASGAHAFLGMGMNGAPSQLNSKGNPTGHIILRGDANGPNYSADHIARTKELLKQKGLAQSIVIDASHGNSGKKAANQMKVIEDVCGQVSGGETAICGVMVESNLLAGAQKLGDPKALVYGQSITDECVNVSETTDMLAKLSEAVERRRQSE
jgi:3-deoxy-7-phosphoheptulonate synthase